MRLKLMVPVLLGAFIMGCAPKAKFLVDPYNPPETLAFMPLRNESLDLEAPKLLRKQLMKYLRGRGYKLIPVEEVDKVLREEFGVNEGGQLGSTTPQQIGEKLHADGLVYGTIREFAFQNIGFYQNKKVAMQCEIIDGKTGQKLWEHDARASKKKLALNVKAATDAFARGLAEKTIGRILAHPLITQINQVASRIARTLPKRQ